MQGVGWYTFCGPRSYPCLTWRLLFRGRDGVLAAQGVGEAIGAPVRAPWLMMSVNDDEEDPHFRKAAFDASLCPSGERGAHVIRRFLVSLLIRRRTGTGHGVRWLSRCGHDGLV